MTHTGGRETPEEVAAMLAEVDQEVERESDPEWYAKYGENLAEYAHRLFGE